MFHTELLNNRLNLESLHFFGLVASRSIASQSQLRWWSADDYLARAMERAHLQGRMLNVRSFPMCRPDFQPTQIKPNKPEKVKFFAGQYTARIA